MTRDPATPATLDELADQAAELAELRTIADNVLSRAWSPARYRTLLDRPEPAYDPRLWATIAELGWPDVMVSEAAGGGGSGLAQLSVLAEAAGAAGAPVPLAAVSGAAWGQGRPIDGIVLLLPEPARLSGSGVSGSWPVVPYGAVACRLLCLAVDDQGGCVLAAVDTAGTGVRLQAVVPLDHNPAAQVTLESAPGEVLARGDEARQMHADALTRVRLGLAAELVGIASVANESAVGYARTRVAFGHPIGSFQAIKHRLVNQRAAIEIARALVNRAAQAVDRTQGDRDALAALAAYWAADALPRIPEGVIQVFGGIGYTWEHEAHTHLRRAACVAAALGPRPQHRSHVIAWLRARHLQ